ncbi:trimeric intracellular cation channel family protein [Flavisolibacter nicotianae]|uniref:trimeric intracellular cation channel family protein n=1 Tax=Flavisolibacter nicotianae TaxID=2364882 RepID=UPI000EAE09FA|nr:trimeric intracellular cation channel family protein [Flavisolibacter nicotianae]
MYSGFLNLIDILGTFAFAVSGVFSAMERKLDIFGILIISFVTAIGGGTIRDILVGNLPVNWLHNDTAIWVILASALLTMVFGSYFKHLNTFLFLFDALGLGLFTIVGLEIGLRKGFGAGICIALGTISACFGGVLRDVLLNKVPLIFQKEIYALACILGGIAYFMLKRTAINGDVVTGLCIFLIFSIRIIAVKFHLSLPQITVK